ncbi:MAG: hypothetical protein CM15mP65_26490 [Crocinitomicaceae bacterium]|nr:MAG: hypothetical protein CM15mP65_26490 [Crocinitomicaceae bacterium]
MVQNVTPLSTSENTAGLVKLNTASFIIYLVILLFNDITFQLKWMENGCSPHKVQIAEGMMSLFIVEF